MFVVTTARVKKHDVWSGRRAHVCALGRSRSRRGVNGWRMVQQRADAVLEAQRAGGDALVVAALESVSYKVGSVTVLENVDLKLVEGEIVCLLGPSGSGKSTLMRIVAGLVEPSKGLVKWHGKPVSGGVNPGTALVFQNFALFPWLTVRQNVELGCEAQGIPKSEREKRARDAIDTIGLDGYENAFPKELSGGMRQRVGFARALAVQPELLCLDEPFSALDVLTAENLRSELLRLWQDKELPTKSILMVTHGIEEAVSIGDRLILLGRDPGRVRAEITVDLPHPRDRKSPEFQGLTDYVYTLISSTDAELEQDRLAVLEQANKTKSQSSFLPPLNMMKKQQNGKSDQTAELRRPLQPMNMSGPLSVALGIQALDPTIKARYPSLPAVRIGSVAGLLLFLDEDQAMDLSHLGQNLQLDVDDLVPIVDAAELLDLIHLESGDVTINDTGKRFLRSSIDERKSIVREGIQRSVDAKLIEQTMLLLRKSRYGRIPQELIFDTILLKHFSPQESRRQLEVAIEWGRFAELFGYDAPSGELFLYQSEEETESENEPEVRY
ncbi:putative ABC transporter ATP-binding protein [Porphyridium purpureum]|uniref:Probable ATP-dependent transporter ycf16 n=1 Tax=Porphyridium purpureum TaxID=35688 RepID=A0A5J4YTA9_PORPP|nr:putative ABC transporter ATP-binding protein [Porphyridium purpureum]|eukprot:POR6331..scf236_6